jgi:uncharacterized protein YutE (UPF0331/DUF86 family)
MTNTHLLYRKLKKLREYLEELKPVLKYSFDEYKKNYFLKRTAERCIQLIVECATDINSHILVEISSPPVDYYESFIKIGEKGIVPEQFAQVIAPSAGLRNRLVHEYEDIKDEIVYKSMDDTIRHFTQYVDYVDQYLNGLNKNEK